MEMQKILNILQELWDDARLVSIKQPSMETSTVTLSFTDHDPFSQSMFWGMFANKKWGTPWGNMLSLSQSLKVVELFLHRHKKSDTFHFRSRRRLVTASGACDRTSPCWTWENAGSQGFFASGSTGGCCHQLRHSPAPPVKSNSSQIHFSSTFKAYFQAYQNTSVTF